MSITIQYTDEQNIENDETCDISDVSKSFHEIKQLITIDQNISPLAQELNQKLSEIKNTKKAIHCMKYSRDTLLLNVIEACIPPNSLQKRMFNYKSIVLYFMRNFTNNIKINSQDLIQTLSQESDASEINEKIFKGNQNIIIATKTDTLLHLINIDKNAVREEKIYEQMIYDTLEFGDYSGKEELFKSKIASVGWIKDTIKKPDYIYHKDNIIAKHLKFDFAFIRETGTGASSQKYMYHLVGIRLAGKSYTIVSQFPIEKDKSYSTPEKRISQLHNTVQCNKAIYTKAGKTIPLYSPEKVSDCGGPVNRLKNGFGK